jgi:hypothetical protein
MSWFLNTVKSVKLTPHQYAAAQAGGRQKIEVAGKIADCKVQTGVDTILTIPSLSPEHSPSFYRQQLIPMRRADAVSRPSPPR